MASDFQLHTSASPYSCMSGRLKKRSHSTSRKRSATEAQVLAWSRSRVAGAPAQSESCSAQRLHRTTERPLKLPPLSSLFGPGREGSRNTTGGQKGSTSSKTCFTAVNELMSKRPQSEAYALTLQMPGRSFSQTITGGETAPLHNFR